MKVREHTLKYLLLCGICVMWLIGCRCSDVEDSMAASSTALIVAPLASSYMVAYETDVLAQGPSIAVGAPKQLYSKKVTKSDLWRMNMQHGCKFYEPWKYMGTKDGEHYLAIYPFLGFREVYRIAEDEYPIEQPYELTVRTSKWREIHKFLHHSIEQLFIIEPRLFETPEALELIQVDGLGGDIEDLLMQDVQILELK